MLAENRAKSKKKPKGWWGSATFEVAEVQSKQNIDPGRWEELTWRQKSQLIALQRALGTMEAWERFVAMPEDN